MPMKRERYPRNWKAISQRIKERAGYRCEACGLANRALILRSNIDPSRYILYAEDGYYYLNGKMIRESAIPEEYESDEFTEVILTVHHVGAPHEDGTPGDPQDKMDCRPENLKCLCQRCHLLADLKLNVKLRKATRNRKRRQRTLDAGQMEMDL